MNDFQISILKNGYKLQKNAYKALRKANVLERLQHYTPFVAGTIPLDIYLDTSDIDIICYAKNLNQFEVDIKTFYEDALEFKCFRTLVRGEQTVIARFKSEGFLIEVFCQCVPVLNQYAVIHFLIEKDILANMTAKMREEIRELKKKGLKTEPAFAQYLGIQGDPYFELVNLDKQIIEKLIKQKSKS